VQQTPNITPVGFNAPADQRLCVEALSVADLQTRATASHFVKLQRANFYRLIGVTEGRTVPMVDFSTFEMQPTDWLLVRPGQVFRYDFSSPWSGWMLVFRPDSLFATGTQSAPDEFDLQSRVEDMASVHVLDGNQHQWLISSLQQMQMDGLLPAPVALRNALLRLQVSNTLLRLSMWQSPVNEVAVPSDGRRAHFRRFCKVLEADLVQKHQVHHYANALGMGEKTLSRVCLAAVGLTAKAVINQRLVLEAKRLLAYTTLPVQVIGQMLGFDDATNFVKFFRKNVDKTPMAFRKHMA
jgi:AraC-like DNA-binding protein